ncbi:hypothetical protein CI266_004934 [Salmonella enterica subsp. enterica serovar Kotte]|nr:hypothetical protein [Salmonella enterica subsp. enterica serovar Kotte]
MENILQDELWEYIKNEHNKRIIFVNVEQSRNAFDSHNVYSVDSSSDAICFTKVGQAETTNKNDLLITLNPFTSVTGQLLICKKAQ